MKEIKFRAWYKPQNEMVEPERLESINFEVKTIGAYIVKDGKGFNKLRMSDFELMQYTGLKDKNGKEIYEGDIIRVNKLTFESKILPENLLVKFYGGMFQMYRGNENLMGLHLQYIEDGEVLGNVYENADLLAEVTP